MFGLKPHKSSVIQRLEQSSFVILTFEYITSILLMVNVDEEGEDALAIGYVLVGLHCAFVVHSLFCVGHIVMDVRRAATEVEGPDASSDAVDARTRSSARRSSTSSS